MTDPNTEKFESYAAGMAAEYRTRLVKEYGAYRAITPINVDGVRAFNVGDPVPISHVERFGYDRNGLVVWVGPPAAGGRAVAQERDRPRLTVLCGGRRLLMVRGDEPAQLAGTFSARLLVLAGERVLAPRPDLQQGVDRESKDWPGWPVIADEENPLWLSCRTHREGHPLNPSRLRAELSEADRSTRGPRRQAVPTCLVSRVS